MSPHFIKTSADVHDIVGHLEGIHDIPVDPTYRGIPWRRRAAAHVERRQIEADGLLTDKPHLLETASGIGHGSDQRQRPDLTFKDIGIPGCRHPGHGVYGS
jgi:hypothetical protein